MGKVAEATDVLPVLRMQRMTTVELPTCASELL